MLSTTQQHRTRTTAQSRRTDEEALAELQRVHGRALFGFLLGLTYGDRQRAEDIVQETLIRVWKHPEVLETDHESMRPWLFTVARNIAIDARRAHQARPQEVGDTFLENAKLPDDVAERSAVKLDVRAALRTLNAEHRAVLVQVYFRGLSVAEASEVLGIPQGTVKSRTYYAIRALRQAMPGYARG